MFFLIVLLLEFYGTAHLGQSILTLSAISQFLSGSLLLFNCGAFLWNGTVLALTPKVYLPNYGEFYEKRWFSGRRVENRSGYADGRQCRSHCLRSHLGIPSPHRTGRVSSGTYRRQCYGHCRYRRSLRRHSLPPSYPRVHIYIMIFFRRGLREKHGVFLCLSVKSTYFHA